MDKASEYLRPYDGSNDVATWIKKAELVVRIKKIEDEAGFIPLHLEGTAFSVFEQMKEEDQQDAKAIKQRLREAFGQNKFAAYNAFRQRSWCPGEAVDAYMSDLRRLAGLAGVESDELIRCAFICGLPEDVSSQLRASARINEDTLTKIVETSRVLMDTRVHGAFVAARSDDRVARRKIKCFECGGDHHARFCRHNSIVCWRCQKKGHMARNCPDSTSSGNATGKSPAPAAYHKD